jgi:hypothetical protein
VASGDYLDLAQASVRAAQGDPSDTTGDLARGKAAVNEAVAQICSSGDPWSFLEKEGQWTVTGGSDTYSFSSIATALSITGATIREIVSLTPDTDGGPPLLQMGWEELERFANSTQDSYEAQGPPVAWAWWGNNGAPELRMYPNPDEGDTFGAFLYLAPSEMSSDTDTPIIPAAFRHAVIVPYAAGILLEQEGGADADAGANRRWERYERNMTRMRSVYGTMRASRFNVVAPGAFSDLPGSDADWGYW